MNNKNIDISKLSLSTTRKRAMAFVIDDILINIVLIVMFWDMIKGGTYETVVLVLKEEVYKIIFLKFLYQSIFIWYYGATVGKKIMKIRVITFDTYKNVSLLQSSLRSIGRVLSELYFYLGFLLAFFTASRQTFHDKIGKTLVVDEIES
ncbi:MAG: RDD family protein [Campylobacteraceae bacterium 4484_166]|nr:MAG: RDD family protein [Campylobacteraceae bacterium 4484_166]